MTRSLPLALLLLGAACTMDDMAEKPVIGTPNPASAHCVKLGGSVEIRKTPQGEVGYCHLPDGRVVEEWQLFRATANKA